MERPDVSTTGADRTACLIEETGVDNAKESPDATTSSENPHPASASSTDNDAELQQAADADPPIVATRWQLYVLVFVLGVANFLVSLDTTILGPAIPAITTEFRTLDHIGWYSSAYLLTMMPFQLILARVTAFFEPKSFFLVFVVGFGVGSVLCATAPSSPVFIFARAVAGFAAAGMAAGSFALLGRGVPMREKPRLLAVFTALQAVAYTTGPTISGALTDSRLTWRFNFWINLPLGAIAIALLLFVVRRSTNARQQLSLREKIMRCDPLGAALLLSCLVLLFLALEWGGNTLPYSSPQVWGLFLGAGLLAVGFAVSEAIMKDKGVIPLRLLRQRTVAVCCLFSCLYGMANVVHVTLLPTYLQTVHSISATMSGVYQLILTFSNLIAIGIAAHSISKRGHYVPFLCAGPLIYQIGSVLLYTLQKDSPAARYLGALVPVGAGFGLSVHASLMAVQAVVKMDGVQEDVALACLLEVFSQVLGRAVGISAAQSVYVGELRKRLGQVPDLSPERAAELAGEGLEGLVAAVDAMPAGSVMREGFREALNGAVTTAFLVPLAATAAAAVVAWGVEWRSMDVSKNPEKGETRAPGGGNADEVSVQKEGVGRG